MKCFNTNNFTLFYSFFEKNDQIPDNRCFFTFNYSYSLVILICKRGMLKKSAFMKQRSREFLSYSNCFYQRKPFSFACSKTVKIALKTKRSNIIVRIPQGKSIVLTLICTSNKRTFKLERCFQLNIMRLLNLIARLGLCGTYSFANVEGKNCDLKLLYYAILRHKQLVNY